MNDEKLKYPPELSDEIFGRLMFDQKYGYYEGIINCQGKEISINIDPDKPNFIDEVFVIAKRFWQDIDLWIEKSNKAIIESSFNEIKNKWFDWRKEPLTKHELVEKLILTHILIDLYSEIHLIYDVEELTYEHTIIVVGTLEIGIENVHLH